MWHQADGLQAGEYEVSARGHQSPPDDDVRLSSQVHNKLCDCRGENPVIAPRRLLAIPVLGVHAREALDRTVFIEYGRIDLRGPQRLRARRAGDRGRRPRFELAQIRRFHDHGLRVAKDGVRQRASEVHLAVIRRVVDGGPVRHGDPKLREERLLGSQIREALALDGEVERSVSSPWLKRPFNRRLAAASNGDSA
jgi:hypothetical protein